jgi:hypothetical protein
LASTCEGGGVTDSHRHRPAGGIFGYDVLGASGEIGREKRLDRRRWFALSSRFGAAMAYTTHDHDP